MLAPGQMKIPINLLEIKKSNFVSMICLSICQFHAEILGACGVKFPTTESKSAIKSPSLSRGFGNTSRIYQFYCMEMLMSINWTSINWPRGGIDIAIQEEQRGPLSSQLL